VRDEDVEDGDEGDEQASRYAELPNGIVHGGRSQTQAGCAGDTRCGCDVGHGGG